MSGSVVLVGVLLFCLVIGVPIGWSLALSSFSAIVVEGLPIVMIVQKLFTAVDSFPMLAIPCFLAAGDIMAKGSISKRMCDLADSMFGSLRGGLSIVAIVACTIFAALTGSALATTAAIGAVMYPAMTERNYPKDFTSAVLAIGGTLGPVIPPSLVFIFYMQATQVSILSLFMSGIGPGVLSCIGMSIVAVLYCKRKNIPKSGTFEFKKVLIALKRSILALLMPIIILGGIYSGIFTATESAGVAVLYGIIVSVFIYKDLKLKDLVPLFKNTAKTTANLMILIAAANVFGYLVAYFNIANDISHFVNSVAHSPYSFLLISGIIFFICGMFMEATATIVILAPLFHPIALGFGIDPVQFGCFMVFVLCLGIATPPFAPTLFVACGMSKEPVAKVTKAIIPFVIEQCIVAVIIALVPAVSVALPNLLL